jgi:hypothetical protein
MATSSRFRLSEFSFIGKDGGGRVCGCTYQIDRWRDVLNGDTYTVTLQPTRDGTPYGVSYKVGGAVTFGEAHRAAEAAVESYRKECGPECESKTFAFGINDTYGRECGCTYQIDQPGKHWQTGAVFHCIRFQALRNGRDYQATKSAIQATAEAAQAKAEAMVEAYRKRCANQFAPKAAA